VRRCQGGDLQQVLNAVSSLVRGSAGGESLSFSQASHNLQLLESVERFGDEEGSATADFQ
jgi:hypothetical protein